MLLPFTLAQLNGFYQVKEKKLIYFIHFILADWIQLLSLYMVVDFPFSGQVHAVNVLFI